MRARLQERLNRYIREAFLAEATHHGIESLDQLNDLFAAWAERVANRRLHAETGQVPIERFEDGGPLRQAAPGLLREAFRWSVMLVPKSQVTCAIGTPGSHTSCTVPFREF